MPETKSANNVPQLPAPIQMLLLPQGGENPMSETPVRETASTVGTDCDASMDGTVSRGGKEPGSLGQGCHGESAVSASELRPAGMEVPVFVQADEPVDIPITQLPAVPQLPPLSAALLEQFESALLSGTVVMVMPGREEDPR